MIGDVTLFVGTGKGLFRLTSDDSRSRWRMDGPHIRGYEVIHTCQVADETHTIYAAARHSVWGAHLYRSRDGGTSWQALDAAPHHARGARDCSLKGIWYLTASPDGSALYAGIDPPGLFVSRDQAATWTAMEGLNDHPTRNRWEPSKGMFAVHSVHVDPEDPRRIYAAVSAGGAYRSQDAGESWQPANRGVRAENLADRFPVAGHNIHRLVMHPAHPRRLYRQCYNGVYRSDDAAETWVEITGDLPSDFGYAINVDPEDPDTLYLVPAEGPDFRSAAGGRLRVFRSTNAGGDWTSVSDGLPREDVYVTVLREGMDIDDLDPRGLYLGTSSGHLFASNDGARTWSLVAEYLPRILSVKVHRARRATGR